MATCFISYAHAPLDQAAVARVCWLLDAGHISYWMDRHLRSQGGLALNGEIAEQIDRCETVIFICSSQSLSSPYCLAEIEHASSKAKRILRLDVEPIRLPGNLLPLASARLVTWHDATDSEVDGRLLAGLAGLGVGAEIPSSAFASFGYDPLDDPNAAIVRPTFHDIYKAPPGRLEELSRRLTAAIGINPDNGFNHLSLSLTCFSAFISATST